MSHRPSVITSNAGFTRGFGSIAANGSSFWDWSLIVAALPQYPSAPCAPDRLLLAKRFVRRHHVGRKLQAEARR